MKRKYKFSGRFALTSVAAAALCFASPLVSALGLGRLNVQSSLGEVLRAEIEITSMTPEEQANLKIRVAPPESYRAANVDYNPVLPSTRATLEKRADGRLYVRLISERGVQEPFVDVILEISWATGRLVREYTLLFDPPSAVRTASPNSSGTTTSPVMSAAPPAPMSLAPSTSAAASAREAREAARAEARERRAAARAAATAATTGEDSGRAARTARASVGAGTGAGAGGDEYRVRSGDSLSKIAGRTQRPGVSLDQMLVSLFRANPDAFMAGNMNRLRSGAVLKVPSTESVQAIPSGEARQTIQAQSADFGAYRQRLAGATTASPRESSARQSGGKVQASVDDKKQGVAPTPDKLTLSKGGATAAAAANSAEAKLSAEREKQAAAARVAELNKNLSDLKRMQGSTAPAAAPAAPAPATTATARPAVPAIVPAPVIVAAAPAPSPVAPAPAPAAAIAPAPVPAVVAPAPAVAAAASVPATAPAAVVVAASSAATPAAVVVAPASAPVAPKPLPRPPVKPLAEPSFFDTLTENPLYLIGGILAALLALFGIYRFTQRSKKDSGETSFLESRLQPDSFFGASGGQRIDTRDAGGSSSSMTYSLSQLDAIGDVDPVAEADVYLAYGRDLQAEEILKEAIRSTPERLAIRTKLLEVYAKRRDIKGFELLATQLFALTRGEGEDWAKTQELGSQIDPDNSLYRVGGSPEQMAEPGQPPEPLGASTMPQSVIPVPSQFGSSVGDSMIEDNQLTDIDLDLDNPDMGVLSGPVPFDATESSPPRPFDAQSQFQSTTLKMPLVANEARSEPDHRDEPLAFDLSGITLDLDKPEVTRPDGGAGAIDMPFVEDDSHQDPLARKLELAEEFQRIGDKDGARDLLREVLATASGSTKTKAQAMIDDLG
ncbi:MAG: FimV/HubP family polar landmark protein [Caldimonas sp.]